MRAVYSWFPSPAHCDGVIPESLNVPTYEFRCPAGHDYQRFFKTISSAPAELACPECGALGSRQLSGGAGLLFKGSGFYLTDYGKNAHRKSGTETPGSSKGGSEGGGSPSSSTSSSGKPESGGGAGGDAKPKPDAKPASTPKPKAE